MEMKNPAIEWHYSAKTHGRCVNSLGCKSATKNVLQPCWMPSICRRYDSFSQLGNRFLLCMRRDIKLKAGVKGEADFIKFIFEM